MVSHPTRSSARTRVTRSATSTSATAAATDPTSTSASPAGSRRPANASRNKRHRKISPGHDDKGEDQSGGEDYTGAGHDPTFELVVLGSGGGPLETDCSGYLVKVAKSGWEDGVLALEGGSGLGALAGILQTTPASDLFPGLRIPSTHDTPILQAAYVFSFLACYLITHAHMDHVGSLIMLSGSVPPRSAEHPQPPLVSPRHASTASSSGNKQSDHSSLPHAPSHPRPHVYGTRKTLEQLSMAYQGGLWPELGSWVPDREGEIGDEDVGGGRKRRKVVEEGDGNDGEITVNGAEGPVKPSEENINSCLLFSPLSTERMHRPLHPTLPITLLTYPVVHGCTSKHTYESSAMFIRYDPGAITKTPPSTQPPSPTAHPPGSDGESAGVNGYKRWRHEQGGSGREFLFFGDVESSYRRPGEEGIDVERGKEAERMNGSIWREAAKSFNQGRLCAIFIECSYDSSRPAHLMFGHLSPPALYHELTVLAGKVAEARGGTETKGSLTSLKVFVIHIKDALVPHPSGQTARQIIMSELQALEDAGALGVQFIETKKGERIVI
ncbi:hypothetical protein IAU60_003815 [Kwoniella sp. DSM 27419]